MKPNPFVKGRDAENRFSALFQEQGWNVEPTPPHIDIHAHIDLIMTQRKTVDVKSVKRVDWGGLSDDLFTWVEIKNVRGNKGWLYGKADYIVFETNDYWLMVERVKLKEFIEMRVERVRVSDKKDALYKLYQRKNRQDLVTLVQTMDMMYLASSIISKKKKEVFNE